MKVQIESLHFKADDKLVAYVEKKLNKLDKYFDKIIDARVTLKLENSGKVKDKIVEVRLAVPGNDVFASESKKTFEAATDLVSDTLKRLLIKHKEKMRA